MLVSKFNLNQFLIHLSKKIIFENKNIWATYVYLTFHAGSEGKTLDSTQTPIHLQSNKKLPYQGNHKTGCFMVVRMKDQLLGTLSDI